PDSLSPAIFLNKHFRHEAFQLHDEVSFPQSAAPVSHCWLDGPSSLVLARRIHLCDMHGPKSSQVRWCLSCTAGLGQCMYRLLEHDHESSFSSHRIRTPSLHFSQDIACHVRTKDEIGGAQLHD